MVEDAAVQTSSRPARESRFSATAGFSKAHIKSLISIASLPESVEDQRNSGARLPRIFTGSRSGKRPRMSCVCQMYVGGQTNISYTADRYLTTARKNKAAFIWEASPARSDLTHLQLHRESAGLQCPANPRHPEG
jgi:hypothetical protein